MDKEQQNRIARFVNDKALCKTIEDFLLDKFTQPVQKESSVEEKAAEWLSIQKLKLAFKDLRNFSKDDDQSTISTTQIGL